MKSRRVGLLVGKYLNVFRECVIEMPRDKNYAEDENLMMKGDFIPLENVFYLMDSFFYSRDSPNS